MAGGVGSVGADSAAGQAKDAARLAIQATRAERYALLSDARKVLSAGGRRAGLQYGHDIHRTAKCKYVRHGFGEHVGVHLDKEHGSAFFSNLINCGSVWSCPVCAVKIQERRRQEIAQAVTWAYAQKLQPVMVTLTFPHHAWNKLGRLLEQQAVALQRLRAGQPWARFKTTYGYEGLIRSLELTHGANGWHPHTHELWFCSSDIEASAMKVDILKRWESACTRAGLLNPANARQLEHFRAHAVDVKGWCSESDYLAKQDDSRHWGVDREMAKASTKQGKAKGMHAFGLLAEAGAGCTRSARLFLVYALTMKAKRKRQIFWSEGLKDRIGVDELSDETLAEQKREAADLLGRLDNDDWKTVRNAGAHAAVLDAAENGGWPAVQQLIEVLTFAEIERLQAKIAALSINES